METNATWRTDQGEKIRVAYRGRGPNLHEGLVIISTGNCPVEVPAGSVELDITLERDTPATLAEREREREAAQIRGERLKRMAARSVRRLAGNCGDLGQRDMFGGNVNLFNRQG